MRPGLGTWGAALAVLFCSLTARAADAPAKFDYWVLSLSWSPEFCVSNFGDEECRQQFGFVVRGLSPQNEHRSAEHTSELQSLMRISYAVFCSKQTQINNTEKPNNTTRCLNLL